MLTATYWVEWWLVCAIKAIKEMGKPSHHSTKSWSSNFSYNCTDINECLDQSVCGQQEGHGRCNNFPGTKNKSFWSDETSRFVSIKRYGVQGWERVGRRPLILHTFDMSWYRDLTPSLNFRQDNDSSTIHKLDSLGGHNCSCYDWFNGTNCQTYNPRRHCADLQLYDGQTNSGVYS